MRTFSMSQLSKNPGAVVDEALKGPVVLTKRNRKTVVVLSVDLYEKLTDRTSAIRSFTPANMPEDVRSEFLASLAGRQ